MLSGSDLLQRREPQVYEALLNMSWQEFITHYTAIQFKNDFAHTLPTERDKLIHKIYCQLDEDELIKIFNFVLKHNISYDKKNFRVCFDLTKYTNIIEDMEYLARIIPNLEIFIMETDGYIFLKRKTYLNKLRNQGIMKQLKDGYWYGIVSAKQGEYIKTL